MKNAAIFVIALSLLAGCLRTRHNPDKVVARISAGNSHACAEMASGKLVCWGDRTLGQFPEASDRPVYARPVAVDARPCAACEPSTRIIAAGDATLVARDKSYALFADKQSYGGRVLAADVSSFFASTAGSCVLDRDGILSCESRAEHAWLKGAGSKSPFASFALSSTHACGIARGVNEVTCYGPTVAGGGDHGALGTGSPDTRGKIAMLDGALAIAVGESFSCALEAGRGVSCWGKNDVGQLGDGSTADRPRPVRVARIDGVHALSLGRNHACAILHDWTTWCWGANAHGELADGTKQSRPEPVMIPGLFDAAEIALGDGFTCVRTNDRDRAARCWGKNDRGQAGDGSTTDRPVPSFVKF